MGRTVSRKLKFHSWYIGLFLTLLFCVGNILNVREVSTSPKGESEGLFGHLDRAMFDFRIRSRGPREMSSTVGLLAVDEKSIAKFGRWPFSRSSYVDAFKNLKKAGVQAIALDVLFPEPSQVTLNEALDPLQGIIQKSTSPSGVLDPHKFARGISSLLEQSPPDAALAQAVSDFERIVQAYMFIPNSDVESPESLWQRSLPHLQKNAVHLTEMREQDPNSESWAVPLLNTDPILGKNPHLGFINNSPDMDGLIRRYQLVKEINLSSAKSNQTQTLIVPSLGLKTVALYLNRKIHVKKGNFIEKISLVDEQGDALEIPLHGEDGAMLINHYGQFTNADRKTTPPIISLADAADNNLPSKVPSILILGSMTAGADDRRPSPLDALANGPEHHVAAVENILRRDFLHRPPSFIINEILFTLAAGFLLCLLLARASALSSFVILIATHISLEIIDRKFIFGSNYIFNFGVFHLQNATIFLGMTLFKYFVEEREKREIKGAFQRYLNPAVINQVLDSPDKLKLGGEKRELTVFFSDVRGFTTISEILSPEALSNLLNEYFTPMTNIVLDSGGLLDKYIGDALMAVWGAPLPVDDHADRALQSALRMLDALDHLKENWKSRNLPAIDIGCGINTGPMVVGNMGSEQRFDYTVLGDAVNLGSRLEGITKEYGVQIVCSAATKNRLRNPGQFLLRELDWIKVKGKNEPVTIYEVMRIPKEKHAETIKTRDLFESGLKKYRERSFKEAQNDFVQALQISPLDGPSSLFLERCQHFIENPVAEDWNGIWVMKSK